MPFPETDQQQTAAWMSSLQDEAKRRKMNQDIVQNMYGDQITPGSLPQGADLSAEAFRQKSARSYGPAGEVQQRILAGDAEQRANNSFGQAQARMSLDAATYPRQPQQPQLPQPYDPNELARQFGVKAQKQPNGVIRFSS